MYRNKTLAPAVATLALVLAFGSPVQAAGKADRARAAIATAEGKIQAGDAAGVSTVLPARQAEARHALNTAKEDLGAGRKEDAVANANRASAIAEAALGEAKNRQEADAAAQQERAQADGAAAQQAAQQEAQARADASAQAQQAQASAQLAQQQAADAERRAADAAQRAANAENQLAIANAAQVETSVTTETKPVARVAATKKVTTKVTKKPVAKKRAPGAAGATVAETRTTVTTVTR